VNAVILVEGVSDGLALEALAVRKGRDLRAEGVSVVAIGGAQAIGRFVERFHPQARLAGLCDAAEERHFRRALERAGLGSDLDRRGMEALGFYVCERDLEDELIRALGVPAVEEVIAARNELGLFRSFQQQPAWRGREPREQLRRFIGTYSGRKIQTGAMLVNALDLDRVPRPLDGVLAYLS
jgi:Overcoming lysogenization defect protein-like, TOPRIM domain